MVIITKAHNGRAGKVKNLTTTLDGSSGTGNLSSDYQFSFKLLTSGLLSAELTDGKLTVPLTFKKSYP